MTQKSLFRFGRSILLALAIPALISACAQTSVVDSWKTEKPVTNKPDKVAVIAVLPEALMRKAVEIDIAKILVDKGTPAVPSSNIKGFSGGIRGEIDVEVATGILRRADVDGVVVMFYSGGGASEGYVRSDYWLQHVGSGMASSWGRPYFTGFTEVYTVRQGPGWAVWVQSRADPEARPRATLDRCERNFLSPEWSASWECGVGCSMPAKSELTSFDGTIPSSEEDDLKVARMQSHNTGRKGRG